MGINDPFGPVHRWKDGDVLWAENNAFKMAYVATDDPEKVGTGGLHPRSLGGDIFVTFISADHARAWEMSCPNETH